MESECSMRFDTVEQAIAAVGRGELVIVADDVDRENEGDLICAADKITPELINFMTIHGRGLICLALPPEIADRLDLTLMSDGRERDSMRTAFTMSIDARREYGVTTGISAHDRARTIQRVGQTEASVDLARMAKLQPAAVICEILNSDGSMARRADLEQFRDEHGLAFVTVGQIVAYRLRHERLVHRVAEANLPTPEGEFRIIGYRNDVNRREHVALVHGDVANREDVLVRVHSKCLTGDVFGSGRCDCGAQLHSAMRQVVEAGAGVIVYLDQEGRGIGLLNKLRAYALQEEGKDTVEANQALGFPPDLRNYGIGAQILADLGLGSIRIMTNNPKKLAGLEGFGLTITGRVPLVTAAIGTNRAYLETKRDKLGHLLGRP